MSRDNEPTRQDIDESNWLTFPLGHGYRSSTLDEYNPHPQPNNNGGEALQDKSISTGNEHRSFSHPPIVNQTQVVSPSTYGEPSTNGTVASIPSNRGSRGYESTNMTEFMNLDHMNRHPKDNESRSHFSRHTSDDVHLNIGSLTYIHYAEIPTRSVKKEEDGFFVGLLGIPNPSKQQIENKSKSIETLKNSANEWGRQYLQHEFVIVSNSLMSKYNLSPVQKFKDIKRMFQTLDLTNDDHFKAMSDIQYNCWMMPHQRSLWKLNMEKQFMSENNLAYKERTQEEVKKYTIGCLAKLFTQIKTDLTKQLQGASKRKYIADSAKQRGFVKKRKDDAKSTAQSRPYIDIFVRPPLDDDVSPLTCEKSVSDFRELQKINSILLQKVNDMQRQINETSSPLENCTDENSTDWNDSAYWGGHQSAQSVSYVSLCIETCISTTLHINMLLYNTLVTINRI